MTTYDEIAIPNPCFKAGGCAPEDAYHPPGMGILTGPPYFLKNDLANCAQWQTWAGSDYLDHIHVIGAGKHNPVAWAVPFAVITPLDDFTDLEIGTQSFVSGSLVLWFQDATPATYYDDPESAFNYFCNNVEIVLVQLFPWTSGSQLKRRLRSKSRPLQNKQDEGDYFYTASYVIDFGVR